MKPLTEDDFGEADSVWMIIKRPLSELGEIRDQILKNQELAKQVDESGFRLVTERDCVIMVGIIERLKKRIGELKDFRDNAPQYEGSGTVEVNKRLLIQLQEIMGVKEKELDSDEEAES